MGWVRGMGAGMDGRGATPVGAGSDLLCDIPVKAFLSGAGAGGALPIECSLLFESSSQR